MSGRDTQNENVWGYNQLIHFAIGLSKDLEGKLDAREMASIVTNLIGGGFGGHSLLTSGGGKNEQDVGINKIFDALEEYIREQQDH